MLNPVDRVSRRWRKIRPASASLEIKPDRGVDEQMRIDERDVIFSRMARRPGSPEYEEYYARHPEREEFDHKVRTLPPLGGEQTPTFDPEVTPVVDGVFTLLAGLHPLTDGSAAGEKMPGDPASYAAWGRKLALAAGASGAGALALDPDHY